MRIFKGCFIEKVLLNTHVHRSTRSLITRISLDSGWMGCWNCRVSNIAEGWNHTIITVRNAVQVNFTNGLSRISFTPLSHLQFDILTSTTYSVPTGAESSLQSNVGAVTKTILFSISSFETFL